MDFSVTDRNVGTLNIKSPLPHHLSPTPNSRKLPRHNSESSVISSTTNPAVPRSSSFTGSKRFLTGRGLSARESLGIIDQPIEKHVTPTYNPHCDYQAARSILKHTLTHSPKQPPPPPHSRHSIPFVRNRPPTPPPLPDFNNPPTPKPILKRVRIDPKPPIELPAATPIHTPPTPYSPHHLSPTPKQHDKKRSPLTPLRNRFSLSSSSPTNSANPSLQHPKPHRPTLFALLAARMTRRDALTTTSPRSSPSTTEQKQNAAPLNIADITSAPKIHHPPRNTDENNKPVFDLTDTSSDDSATHQVPNAGKPILVPHQMPPSTNQRPHAPLAPQRKMVQIVKDNESTETTESEKYKDCESPVSEEPRRRVEIFKRFRFVQEGRQRPMQLSDFVQTDVFEQREERDKHVYDTFNMPSQPHDPISHHEDKLSFTSGQEDGERSSDERAPHAMRDIRKGPRIRMALPRTLEPEPKLLEEEEKGHLPHVESITTSSSSHSKDTSDSPPVERKMANIIHDTSVPFTQVEMPHLRLGKGTVSAHAFMHGPSPSKMGKVAHLRRDSHAAFLTTHEEPKLEEIKYGGHQGERETTPLGSSADDGNFKEGGDIKKTMSGLQRKLKEAGAELVNKAKKIPRGTSFSKLRSNSMKDLRSGNAGTESEPDGETEADTIEKHVKGIERSKSLPRDSMRQLARSPPPKSARANDDIEKRTPRKEEKKKEEIKQKEASPELPEFVTIKRIIRRVRRDGTEEMITKKVRVRPEQILPNGDVVIKRTMKRNKDDGEGTETLTVLQVIPRRKNVKKTEAEADGVNERMTKDKDDVESLPDLSGGHEDEETPRFGITPQSVFDEGPLRARGRDETLRQRRSSVRSNTDLGDEDGRWRRARSFGRVRGDAEGKERCEQSGRVIEGMKGLLPKTKSSLRGVDRETAGLGDGEQGKTWLKKKSLPRVMSFHGRGTRRKESGASSKSEGSWWRFRRTAA